MIIASKGGASDHPAWFKNFSKNSERIEIQVKGDRFPVTASVTEGPERERLWTLMTEAWPDYDDYQSRTDRQILWSSSIAPELRHPHLTRPR